MYNPLNLIRGTHSYVRALGLTREELDYHLGRINAMSLRFTTGNGTRSVSAEFFDLDEIVSNVSFNNVATHYTEMTDENMLLGEGHQDFEGKATASTLLTYVLEDSGLKAGELVDRLLKAVPGAEFRSADIFYANVDRSTLKSSQLPRAKLDIHSYFRLG